MKIEKCHKLACNLYNKNKNVTHIRTLKEALNHGLILKLVTTNGRRNYLVSEPNYHTAKGFSKTLLAIEMKKNNKSKNE